MVNLKPGQHNNSTISEGEIELFRRGGEIGEFYLVLNVTYPFSGELWGFQAKGDAISSYRVDIYNGNSPSWCASQDVWEVSRANSRWSALFLLEWAPVLQRQGVHDSPR